jgi:adenylate kinase
MSVFKAINYRSLTTARAAYFGIGTAASKGRANPSQKFLVLFGAPGVGKGTYAGLLAKDLQFNKISTGDEIRKIIKGGDTGGMDKALVDEIRNIVNSGKLVSDDIVLNILQEKLREPASQKGVILDGFPRTLSQLSKYSEKFPVDLVVNVELRDDILLEKLLARRTCIGCGNSYNVCSIHRDGYEMEPLLPKKEGECDKCGSKLVIRDDDTETVITSRMKEYNAKTLPLLDEYKKKGSLMNFEVKRGVKDYPKLIAQVRPALGL